MSTDEIGQITGHRAALGRLRTKKAQILYALEHLPRGCTVEDVRRWLSKQGQLVPSRPYTTPIVNEWRARNGMTDTSGHVPLTPELIAELDAELDAGPDEADRGRAGGTGVRLAPELIAELGGTGQAAAPLTPQLSAGPGEADHDTRRTDARPVPAPAPPAEREPAGAKGFYAVALLSIGVSVDTSWRFFEQRLGITETWERVVLFSVMEAALVACGWAMRAGVRQDGRPGPARLVAWALTAFAAFSALSLSGPVAGTARVLLGPVLGLVMLHLALGIEIRASRQRTTTWARVGRELRERVLSVLGLGDDHRDALARTRDRAALRAAKLALAGRWTPLRKSRLRKALHVSHVAHDPVQRDRMLRELGVLQHAEKLAEVTRPAPW
ncbi:hypothetical protein SAMN05216188_106162 [Lentzea xinjiangensis]|uniref:Uncharacterized protein n=1 Tax=Lentzea xinjiangensis TaxID=402600 RepID=A0A1H9JVY1_9PSEU|nr:hypothetical protein [Lentzea xinjiangensis]SEQ90695.1 hypothetical protein SAMN05216188_106162 [Lentzea xinjiangensis]